MDPRTGELQSCGTVSQIPVIINAPRPVLGLDDPMTKQVSKIKVYLDDEREAPEGWIRVYWPEEAIELLKTGNVEELSLDHDLGDDDRGTGYDVILWIEEQVVLHNFNPPKIRIHTANLSARLKMENGVKAILKRSIGD